MTKTEKIVNQKDDHVSLLGRHSLTGFPTIVRRGLYFVIFAQHSNKNRSPLLYTIVKWKASILGGGH